MEQFAIAARRRDKIGTSASRAYRREGLLPAVVYGHGQEPISILVTSKDLQRFLRHHGNIAALQIEGVDQGEQSAVQLKETRRHPVSRELLSADFQWISLKEVLQVSVPVVLIGEAPGVTIENGVLEQTLYELNVECLPTAIPESIEVDVSSLHAGHTIHLGDITAPAGIKFVDSDEETICTIAKAISAADLENSAEAAAAAPEEAVSEE